MLAPAELEFAADGTPRSARYDDVYHSRHGALAQACHVFIEGSALAERWATPAGSPFVILENGFGLGTNFLATVAAWRAHRRGGRLHYLATELHPLRKADLARWLDVIAGALTGIKPEIDGLRAQWPLPFAGSHRLNISDDIALTLMFDESLAALTQYAQEAGVDAVFLDGFAPARNPGMWSPAVLKAITRLCREGATVATWCVAGEVRRLLAANHWQLARPPGFGGKRAMLVGRYQPPPYASRSASRRGQDGDAGPCAALVVGAGLAGALVSAELARRGCSVTLLEAHRAPGNGASGIPAALLRPRLTVDDALAARLARQAYDHALRRLCAPGLAGWHACGVLHVAEDENDADYQRQCVARHGFPPAYVEWLTNAEIASRFSGQGIAAPWGGWWFPQGGWLVPSALCAHAIAGAGAAVALRPGTEIAQLTFADRQWHALDAAGGVRASAPVAVIATAHGTHTLLEPGMRSHLPLEPVRGQLSALSGVRPLTIAVCGNGHITPAQQGLAWVGASFEHTSQDTHCTDAGHHENMARLQRLLATRETPAAATIAGGWAGLRAMTPDRLPYAGAVPDVSQMPVGDPGFSRLPRLPGLHMLAGLGARGTLWAPLLAEIVASRITGEPLPVPSRFAEALDPGRYWLRWLRRNPLPQTCAPHTPGSSGVRPPRDS